MRLITTLLLLVLAAPCNASPLLFLMQGGDNTESFTLNGIGSISQAGPTTTGAPDEIDVGDGFITAVASCDIDGEDDSFVQLTVGATSDSINCLSGGISRTLSVAVTPGTVSVQVSGTAGGAATFSATNFRKPKP